MATSTTVQEQVRSASVPYPPLEVGFSRLVEDIVRHSQPLRVIAFGSRARGTHKPNSDLDLAIIVDDRKRAETLVCEARRMTPAFFSVDMLVIEQKRQEWMKESIVSVEHQIDKEGIVLYDSTIGINYGAFGRLAR